MALEHTFLHRTYRLTDVLDKAGQSKVQSRALYRERVGCLAQNLRLCDYGGADVVRMIFVQDPNGNWINRTLRTSPVESVTEDSLLTITTENSVYLLEPAPDPVRDYGTGENLLELFLSDEGDRFCRGVWYDGEGLPHDLACLVHAGMFVDSCLITPEEEGYGELILCRYFLREDGVEFYNSLYWQDPPMPLLLHNCGGAPLRVELEGWGEVCTIPPGGQETVGRPGAGV